MEPGALLDVWERGYALAPPLHPDRNETKTGTTSHRQAVRITLPLCCRSGSQPTGR